MVVLFNQEKFVLLVGEYGAILALFEGKNLKKRLFASGSTVADRKEFNALLSEHPEAPVSLLLDIMDQNYSQQEFPAVSPLAIDKLVKKRMERDFSSSDINGYLQLGRKKNGRKDWRYLLVSATRTAIVDDWLDYITSLPNPFKGIFLLPIETAAMSKHLPVFKKAEKSKKERWQLVISHNKVSGIRQTVICDGKPIFSRLIVQGKENLPDLIAGFIEQETLNTIEYLGRLSFDEESELEITIIVSDDIREHLTQGEIRGYYTEIVTPNKIAEVFSYSDISQKNDKFADIFFAAHFLNNTPQLRLNTDETAKLTLMASAIKYAQYTVAAVLPPLLLYSLFLVYQIYSIDSDMAALENEKIQIESQWKSVQDASDYDIDESSRITEIVGLHSELKKVVVSPNLLFKQLSGAVRDDAVIKTVQWKYNQSFNDNNRNNDNDGEGSIDARFELEFLNLGENIDELFNNFELFTRRLKREFRDYDVTNTKLPEKITLGEAAQIINMTVTISSRSE